MERRKLIVLFASVLVAIAGLEARLFWLQVVEFGKFEEYRRARSHIEIVTPMRGEILDRRGRTLARDERDFALDVVLEDFEKDPAGRVRLERLVGEPLGPKLDAIAARIDRLADLRPAGERRAIVRREKRTPYPLVPRLKFEQAFEIDANADFYPGLLVRERLRRTYPEGADAAAVTGSVGRLQENELGKVDTSELEGVLGAEGVSLLAGRGAFQDAAIGRGGVEEFYDARLRGGAGLVLRERPAGSRAEQRLDLLAPRAGEPVRLTIDLDVQKAARAALGGRAGCAIVMDVRDGAVLALVSEPTFDANDFVSPADAERVRGYLAPDANAPLLCRPVAGRFNLGSIFKIVTATAALEEAVATPDRVIECTGKFDRNQAKLNCWIFNHHRTTHGPLTLPGALERSCNIYFFTTAVEMGMPRLASWAQRFGYGAATGVDLPNEKRGLVPGGGTDGEAAQLGIGQTRLLVTPMQVAVMVAAVANGGDAVTPHVRADAAAPRRAVGISPATLDALREGLRRVVEGPEGTAHTVASLRELRFAGKTGTAQTSGVKGDHAWFAGYFPREAPRVAVVVLLEHVAHGESGGATAGPAAAAIAQAISKGAP